MMTCAYCGDPAYLALKNCSGPLCRACTPSDDATLEALCALRRRTRSAVVGTRPIAARLGVTAMAAEYTLTRLKVAGRVDGLPLDPGNFGGAWYPVRPPTAPEVAATL